MRESEALESLEFRPTLLWQCWGFMIGSALFALGAAPHMASLIGSGNANLVFFVGSWFFTGAGLVQWALAGAPMTRGAAPRVRADWLTAVTQSVGTVFFNISTGAAVDMHSTAGERALVWSPNAAGSVAFLISGAVAIIGYRHVSGWWRPRETAWWAVLVNFLGCVLFGLSAVGSYVSVAGVTEDAVLANMGTCLGAVCFFVCSALLLPGALRAARARH